MWVCVTEPAQHVPGQLAQHALVLTSGWIGSYSRIPVPPLCRRLPLPYRKAPCSPAQPVNPTLWHSPFRWTLPAWRAQERRQGWARSRHRWMFGQGRWDPGGVGAQQPGPLCTPGLGRPAQRRLPLFVSGSAQTAARPCCGACRPGMSGEDLEADHGVAPAVRPRVLDPAAAAPKALASMAEAPAEVGARVPGRAAIHGGSVRGVPNRLVDSRIHASLFCPSAQMYQGDELVGCRVLQHMWAETNSKTAALPPSALLPSA